MMNRHDTVGECIVNHCVNDILVQGAKPLFFMDYIAASHLSESLIEQLMTGLANGCRKAGCALIGGETAELPGMYQPGHYDLVGFITGLVSEGQDGDRRRHPARRRAAGPGLRRAAHQRLLAGAQALLRGGRIAGGRSTCRNWA